MGFWGDSKEVSGPDLNLNKMFCADGTATGIYEYAFVITSDGLGNEASSFTITGLLDENVSVSSYNAGNSWVVLAIAGRTLNSGDDFVFVGMCDVNYPGCTVGTGLTGATYIKNTTGAAVNWDSVAGTVHCRLLTNK